MNRRDILKKLGACCVAVPFLSIPSRTLAANSVNEGHVAHQVSMDFIHRTQSHANRLLIDCVSKDENVSKRALQTLSNVLCIAAKPEILKKTQLALESPPCKFKALLYGTSHRCKISKKHMREARWDIVITELNKLTQIMIDKLNIEKDRWNYECASFRLHYIELTTHALYDKEMEFESVGFDLYCCGSGA